MSTNIASNAAFNNVVFRQNEAFKAKAALLAPAFPAGEKPREVPVAPNKLFDGLNQQAAFNLMALKVQANLQAKAQSKEPPLDHIKSVIIAPNLKKDPKESTVASVGRHDDDEKPTGLFANLRLEARNQEDGSVDPDAE
jgi:hypothetical protein